jgi:hypothetical protein
VLERPDEAPAVATDRGGVHSGADVFDMDFRREKLKALVILALSMAATSIFALLVEVFVANADHRIHQWGVIRTSAALSVVFGGTRLWIRAKKPKP